LLAGSDPGGTKYNKAIELGVPVLDLAGLLALIATSTPISEAPSTDGSEQMPLDLL
jgi:BRCT domain type II-containing protein